MRISLRLLLCGSLLAVLGSAALLLRGADASSEANQRLETCPGGNLPAISGAQPAVKAFVDGQGNLIAPPEAARAAAPAVTRSFSSFTTEQTERGGVLVNFNDGWQNAAIAHVGPDGRVSVECVPVGSGAAATTEKEE